MPLPLARKLLICAAVDGLIIQPLAPKGQRPSHSVKVKYGEGSVSSTRDQLPDISKPNSSFEAFGIIGLFTVSRLSYLITITGRQEVAQVRGYPVYVVTDVALTPCTSQSEAEDAIRHTSIQLLRAASANNRIDEETEPDDVQSDRGSVSGEFTGQETKADKPREDESRSSVAEDVIKLRGSYGRFAQRWFSHKGWVQDSKRNMGISEAAPKTQEGLPGAEDKKEEMENKALSKAVVTETASAAVATAVSTGESLLPKLLRTAHIWFGSSKSFFFSYDVDITRNLANSTGRGATAPDSPLHKTADPNFFWNRNLLQRFSAEDFLLLPLMQGFVGQTSFIVDKNPPQHDDNDIEDSLELREMPSPRLPGSVPDSPPSELEQNSVVLRPSEKKYLITVISRRSIKRAGLRYLRRGVDDEGNAANAVETEQLLSTSAGDGKIFSFVQIRGSIPLFFQQSPYSLKPVPVLQHSEVVNLNAFTKHFEQLQKKYGKVQLVNLVEKHGPEAVIGDAYARNVEKYNKEIVEGGEQVGFEWFDFHSACRGMKFENVNMLLDTLGRQIEELSSTVENISSHEITQKQKGVLRTNCMDCLDRTNVCQSSFAKYVLELQLKEEGFDLAAQLDQKTSWFNMLWADNGDAISKQYASTAAMKGDYTRTRKRDYRGMVNDLGLSLTRFYNGMVNDYFSQAAIDFFLGNVTFMVFEEFEATMMTKDPAVSMGKMREQAIETSRKIVVSDDSEDFIGGWTVLSPHQSNTIRSLPMEEVVLLLTDAALYLCRFNWTLDKVSSFERVDLAHIVGLQVGTYITSTISPAQADETKNVGLVVTYEPGKNDIKRVNTRSLSSISGPSTSGSPASQEEGVANPSATSGGILAPIFGGSAKQQAPQPPRKIALKALNASNSIADVSPKTTTRMTEMEQIEVIAAEIERLVSADQPQANRGNEGFRERSDIISLAEAKKNTGILEQWGHTIKKLVWA
ncbi:SacI homology domain-containing protein [Pseudomassariella vexata]|uniref:SacI homology domain-domain-containing protein n=1 Tax=Pseudomassariella vexata TaxID=1141098 RepID=A0A1Y2ED18_9PEZI|nr:SacI homology domain-containing protein [Pseudomassariella vexata]ORY68705.1 SacI homology domain-domain-containing protein [Pseudomassariella vexata]